MKKAIFFNALMLILLFLSLTANAENYTGITPGELWNDNNAGHIQAHGGCVIWDEPTQKYYWYGEARKVSEIPNDMKWLTDRDMRIGVSCYSSDDLYNWKYEGLALKMLNGYTDKMPEGDLQPYRVLERPKVIYNEKTKKYVMWMHIDSSDYGNAHAGVAVSDSPTGPFKYMGSERPNDKMARDMTVFVDDDGTAYLYASGDNNMTMYCHRLSDDYLSFDGTYTKMFENKQREAPAVFKYNNKYYIITSGCSGWAPNKADYAVADNPMGPWSSKGNPCSGDKSSTTFGGQGCYVLPLDRENGKFIFMADIWKPDNQSDSRYIWLPIQMLDNNKIKIEWQDEWHIEDIIPPYNVPDIPNIVLSPGEVYKTEIETDGLKNFRIVSVTGDCIKAECENGNFTVYALKNGKSEVELRLGGGGYCGVGFKVDITVGEDAKGYSVKDGRALIDAADALLNTEYAYSYSRGYHYWEKTDGLKIMPDSSGEWRNTDRRFTAPALNYRIKFENAGEYYVLLNCSHENISGNSLYIGLNGEYIFTSTGEDNLGDNIWLSDNGWKISIPEAGVYTLNVWGREDGSVINKVAISDDFASNADDFEKSTLTAAKTKTEELTDLEKLRLDMSLNNVRRVLSNNIEYKSYFGTEVKWLGGGDIIDVYGKVNRPGRGTGDAFINLTAIYINGSETMEKEYKVIVKEDTDEIISSSDFSVHSIGAVTGKAFITFDVTVSEKSDGIIALCSGEKSPGDWADYPVTVRIRPEGVFDARNGGEYTYTEKTEYSEGFVYHICISLNVPENKYSAYVTDPVGNVYTLADEFDFRFAAESLTGITVRGGSGVKPKLFSVGNLYVGSSGVDIFNVSPSGESLMADIMSLKEEKSYAAFYENGSMTDLAEFNIGEGFGTYKIPAPKQYDYAKVMIMDKNLEPKAESFRLNGSTEFFLAETDFISSSQNNEALHALPKMEEFAVYSFEFTDNGSVDSGIILGNSEYLNVYSRNYFASGSIVLLFSDGKIYTRDKTDKNEVGSYTPGNKVKIHIMTDISSNTYSLYINGEKVGTDIAFRTEIQAIDTAAFVENKGGEMFTVNDFNIK